ncbi:MAG: 1-deoxy-D-xylulose-5-phosphate reductoisomerase [Chloracidobacterium sp.]|nr:1-deoxy-D-xylulose-5-phosphate reductoisomerase [Chloracidobacterium sp.]MDW8216442.1 1-deoxy-D-xylulose-5-phosphate reductoisomerase [Acidobacteriota bacterium]
MTGLAILGSTGSIGCNTLNVVEHLAPRFTVAALAAGRNVERLAEQIRRHRPQLVAVADDVAARRLRDLVASDWSGEIAVGVDGMTAVATHPAAAVVMSAVVGGRGLLPTLRAIELGRRVCIANKEPLVMAGELMMRRARECGAEILPVDSEHNALHQCLRGNTLAEVHRLVLTASGGPFRTLPAEGFPQITVAQALRHPTWTMGRKITIDSATLMNKGLEVIEARWLYDVPPDRIEVVIHPQSVVHSLVAFVDGSTIAQLGVADMRHPIQYALTYPERRPAPVERLDLTAVAKLEFYPPDMEKFPCLRLAYDALRAGGTFPAVLNAANEEAVAAFLEERIRFTDIPRIIETTLGRHDAQPTTSLEAILAADAWARREARRLITAPV